MGTNYHYEYNHCLCCKRYDSLHIGKSSAGWTFTFHGTDEIRSYADWLRFFEANEGQIVDEYQCVHTVEAFKAMVADRASAKHNHAREYPGTEEWLDPEGHSFSGHWFS